MLSPGSSGLVRAEQVVAVALDGLRLVVEVMGAAAIVAIRTTLNFFLTRELREAGRGPTAEEPTRRRPAPGGRTRIAGEHA